MRTLITLMAIFCATTFFSGPATGQTVSNDSKIEMLIESVGKLQGAKFYRNGSWYDAAQASSHLKMKWSKAGSAIKTPMDFIDKLATKSSVSGEPYKIKLADGKELACRDFLIQKLKEIEKRTAKP